MAAERELRNSIEYLPGRLYFVALSGTPPASQQKHFFSIDNELVYWNFFLDFGPLNLGQTYRFCALLNNKLSDARLKDKVIYFYSGTNPQKRANAAFLLCAWGVLCLDRLPEDAFAPFKPIAGTFPSWHDATPTICTFNLTILDTLKGLHKARECKFFDFKNFNIEEYEYFEKVENGDLSWCMDGKFIAFAGPHATRETSPGGYQTLCPEHYIPYYKRKNVTLVIRLNKKYYDSKRFTSQGIDHCDLYFLDGSNPPAHILRQFIQRCEETRGAVAVHCKAGLGRTGCCIGCYIMKHFRFTAEEIIGWLRIVRPGSIIGPQQDWMREMEQQMWREGELFRARLQSLTPPNIDAEEQSTGSGKGGASAEVPPAIGAANRTPSGSRLSLTVRSGSNSQLLAAQAAAMAKEEEGASQGDQLRARRQMKGSDSPNPNSPASGVSPVYQPSSAAAMSPLSRSGSRSLLTNSSSLGSPNRMPSTSAADAPSTPTHTSHYHATANGSAAGAAPSPIQGAPQSPASPTKRKTTLGSFLGLS